MSKSQTMRAPAFQFYPQDFLVGTADLTCEEVGAYIRLLCYQWAKGGLPNEEEKLRKLSGITSGLSLGNVWVKFRLCDDGLLRNDRLAQIRLDQDYYFEKQRKNGKNGGNPNFKKGMKNPYYQQVTKDNPKDNPKITHWDNPKITSSSSSSSSYIYKEVIDYLNAKTGKKFEVVDGNTKFISARLKEGFTLETMKAVIDLKCKEWLNDPKWSQYLRPSTLFNAEKFASYSGSIGEIKPEKEKLKYQSTEQLRELEKQEYLKNIEKQKEVENERN